MISLPEGPGGHLCGCRNQVWTDKRGTSLNNSITSLDAEERRQELEHLDVADGLVLRSKMTRALSLFVVK